MQDRTISSLLAAFSFLACSPVHAVEYNVVYPFPITNSELSTNMIPQYRACFAANGDKLNIHVKPGGDTIVGAKFAIENNYSIITTITGKEKNSTDEIRSLLGNSSLGSFPLSYFRYTVIKANNKASKDDVIFVTTANERGISGDFAREIVANLNLKNVVYIYLPTAGERITYTISNLVDYALVPDSDAVTQLAREGRFNIVDYDNQLEGLWWFMTKDKDLESKFRSCTTKINYPSFLGKVTDETISRWKKRFQ
jgi:hypothetical protein